MTKIHIRHPFVKRSLLYKICDRWEYFFFCIDKLCHWLLIIVKQDCLTCSSFVENYSIKSRHLCFERSHTKGVNRRQVDGEDVIFCLFEVRKKPFSIRNHCCSLFFQPVFERSFPSNDKFYSIIICGLQFFPYFYKCIKSFAWL